MKLSQTQKLILAILIFAVTGYVIYTSFFTSKGSLPASGAVSGDLTTNDTIQAITDLSDKIKHISIDTQFFSSPVFASLVDFNFPRQFEQQGRLNPFADIGSDGVAATASTSALIKKK